MKGVPELCPKGQSCCTLPITRGTLGFTLVELLVVIGIIAVLLAIGYPAAKSVGNGAKKGRAAVDVQKIVVAIESFEVEYGRLPRIDGGEKVELVDDAAVGDLRAGITIPNREILNTLRAIERGANADAAINFRKVVFLEGPDVKNPARPAGGFLSKGAPSSDLVDCFFDPWGRQYCIALDYSGDEKTKLAYVDFSGSMAPAVRAAVFSMGPDCKLGCNGDQAVRKGGLVSDDIVSW
jgi:prepilin-type N-terminal cleavage/methylation domain-containing protein